MDYIRVRASGFFVQEYLNALALHYYFVLKHFIESLNAFLPSRVFLKCNWAKKPDKSCLSSLSVQVLPAQLVRLVTPGINTKNTI